MPIAYFFTVIQPARNVSIYSMEGPRFCATALGNAWRSERTTLNHGTTDHGTRPFGQGCEEAVSY
jgi:hypothetical protein